jgi:protocatechuate 3,4-dioxygenase beta subunit
MATGPAATTQDDGTFALPGVTEVGDLRATKEGYAPAFARAVAPGQAEVGFVLGDLGSISGIVRDEKGGPVEAFEVEARSAGGGFAGMGALFPAGRAEVLGGGKFRIAGVVAGEYDVRVYAGDLAPGVVPGVAVKEGEETGGLVIRLTAGATLRGIVTAGEGGPPVSGAQVSADITGNPVLARARQGRERSATTGEDGRFVLSGLPEGSTTVKVVHPDYAPRTLDNVRLPATDELVIQLSAGGTVVVRVLLEDGSPDPGKMVILQRNVPYEQKIAMADPRGEARFEKVPPGGWMVMRMDAQAMQKKGFSAADMEMRIAEVSDGEETVVEIRPSRGASIRGRVTRGGRPVSGAMVFLTGQGEAQEAISGMKFGTTAEDGTYSLDRVPPGEHTIAVSRPNNFVPVFSEKVVVGDRDVTKNLAMPPGGAAGTVTDERGSPLGGVQVLAVPSDRADFRSGSMNDAMHAFGGMTTSASDGSFRFEGLAPGGYVLRVWREGMAPAYSDPFSMPELGDGPHDLSVRVPAGTDQKVEVRGPDGSPLEGAWVYVTDPAGRLLSIGMNQGVRTDPAGVAVLRLAPGPYRVEVQPPRLPAVSRSVTVPGGTIRIDVPTGGTISATVRDAAGKAVAGARVRLRNPAGQEAGRRMTGDVVVDAGHPTRTDADGRIELPLIAPGRWRIEARTEDGRAAEATVEVTAGATAEVTLTLE